MTAVQKRVPGLQPSIHEDWENHALAGVATHCRAFGPLQSNHVFMTSRLRAFSNCFTALSESVSFLLNPRAEGPAERRPGREKV